MAALLLVMLVGVSWGCGASPAGPSDNSNPVGTWVGTASDTGGTRQIRFDLHKSLTSDSKFDGLINIQPPDTFGRLGLIDATLSRSTLSFTLTIPGGCSPFGPACDLVTTGSATIDAATMTGSYTCTANCTDLMRSGTLRLARCSNC